MFSCHFLDNFGFSGCEPQRLVQKKFQLKRRPAEEEQKPEEQTDESGPQQNEAQEKPDSFRERMILEERLLVKEMRQLRDFFENPATVSAIVRVLDLAGPEEVQVFYANPTIRRMYELHEQASHAGKQYINDQTFAILRGGGWTGEGSDTAYSILDDGPDGNAHLLGRTHDEEAQIVRDRQLLGIYGEDFFEPIFDGQVASTRVDIDERWGATNGGFDIDIPQASSGKMEVSDFEKGICVLHTEDGIIFLNATFGGMPGKTLEFKMSEAVTRAARERGVTQLQGRLVVYAPPNDSSFYEQKKPQQFTVSPITLRRPKK